MNLGPFKVGLLLAASSVPQIFAQTPAPTFDVASVKPNKSGEGGTRIMFQPGGRFVATNIDLKSLIRLAYDVQYFPTTYVIDPQGILRARYIDVIAPAQLARFVTDAQAGRNGVIVSPLQQKIDALLSATPVVESGDPAAPRPKRSPRLKICSAIAMRARATRPTCCARESRKRRCATGPSRRSKRSCRRMRIVCSSLHSRVMPRAIASSGPRRSNTTRRRSRSIPKTRTLWAAWP